MPKILMALVASVILTCHQDQEAHHPLHSHQHHSQAQAAQEVVFQSLPSPRLIYQLLEDQEWVDQVSSPLPMDKSMILEALKMLP